MTAAAHTPPSPATDYIDEVFGSTGLLSQQFPGYRPRPGQLMIARAVDDAMRGERHALAEGPTGTGKSLAYCVPATYHAATHKRRVVLATANIALQEQLVEKDLPLLQRLVPWEFSFALLKGRSNYLCLNRLERGRRDPAALDPAHAQDHAAIVRWAQRTETGDSSELSFQPARSAWSSVSVGSDECAGKTCRFATDCYYERQRRDATAADVIVTNYHLLFAHLSMVRLGGPGVLPPFDLLVMDEAHEAADIARAFFGFAVSARGVELVAQQAAACGFGEAAVRLDALAPAMFVATAAYATSAAYDRRLKTPDFVDVAPLVETLAVVQQQAEARSTLSILSDDEQTKAARLASRAKSLAGRMSEAVSQSDDRKVYWIDTDARGTTRLKASYVDVSGLLRRELFGATRSVCAVSATLSIAGSFSFVRRELGVPRDALEVVAPSPFDHRRQALLVVPAGLPGPNEPEFLGVLAAVSHDVITRCGGRTLGLFTSYRALDAVYQALPKQPFRILRQGDAPRSRLVDTFRREESSVLLGTTSLWTGVDVPGPSLSALVIDKLPFPHPGDPLVDAICARDSRAFATYLLPKAIMTLLQGVGRLLRSESDRGVVVLLDRRLRDKAYGARVLRALPDMRTTRRLADIDAFMARPDGAAPSQASTGTLPR